ncbi:hypothetical protein [Peptoclostridium litorale]|nr:hypothetical protein [Peptoclostridium litorale]
MMKILKSVEIQVSKNTKLLELIDNKVDVINKIDDIKAPNADRQIDISRDIKFIKHKMRETEENVFIIKRQLKLAK